MQDRLLQVLKFSCSVKSRTQSFTQVAQIGNPIGVVDSDCNYRLIAARDCELKIVEVAIPVYLDLSIVAKLFKQRALSGWSIGVVAIDSSVCEIASCKSSMFLVRSNLELRWLPSLPK